MRFIDWFSDSLASIDVVDGCITELKDINLTDEEQTETAFFDAMAEDNQHKNDDRPMGKRVY